MRTGLCVTHPITGEPVEVWVGNYVLMSYGDGAVMGVPAHDERDFAFALKYGIEIKQVVLVDGETFDYHHWQDWYGDKERGVTINSDNFSGMGYQEAVNAVAHALEQVGLGEKKTTWRLRDWGVSRQRYWGTPIPIIHCDACGVVPVPEKDLPVVLPEDLIPDGSGNPLNKCEAFLNVPCPVCGAPSRRETDTMDTFVDSSWYFMRYCDPKLDDAMVGAGTMYWMPMDQYIGGIEHAILHLLYARFWTKVMRDLGLVTVDEPFSKLLTQGMVLNHIYSRRTDKGGIEYFWPHEVDNVFDEHGAVPVPEKDLPVVLPADCVPDGSGNPLHKHEGFHAGVTCPVCGKAARRETDTMDTFVDSSWYFMRYCDPKNADAMVAGGADYWMPMDQYIGGIEDAILHLLYARFWTKVMRDLGLVKIDEPFTKLLTQGMVLNHIYSRRTDKGGKEYFWPHDVEHVLDDAGKVTGARLKRSVESGGITLPAGTLIDYEGVGTMSKSKSNGVDPQDIIEKFGADTARLYTMFTSPPEATLEWNDAGVEGSYRFLRRVWNFGVKLNAMNSGAVTAGAACATALFDKETKALRLDVHTLLKQVDYDYQRMQYNTVVSGTMKLLNALEDGLAPTLVASRTALPPEGALRLRPGEAGSAALAGVDSASTLEDSGRLGVLREGFGILLRCLYPAAPHLTHSLWNELGYAAEAGELLDAPWPEVDASALQQDEIELMLQINGKLRGAVTVPAGADKATIEAAALATEAFIRQAAGAPAKKVIVVPGRLVNIVV